MARLGERAIGVLGMVLVAPVAGLIALAIMIIDPGPVLTRRIGVGRDGRRFAMYRFRTDALQRGGSHEMSQAGSGQCRMTPVGAVLWATRLDEIPLLVNLWRGDLRLIDHGWHLVRLVK